MEVTFIQHTETRWCVHDKETDGHVARLETTEPGTWLLHGHGKEQEPQTHTFLAPSIEDAEAYVQDYLKDAVAVKGEADITIAPHELAAYTDQQLASLASLNGVCGTLASYIRVLTQHLALMLMKTAKPGMEDEAIEFTVKLFRDHAAEVREVLRVQGTMPTSVLDMLQALMDGRAVPMSDAAKEMLDRLADDDEPPASAGPVAH